MPRVCYCPLEDVIVLLLMMKKRPGGYMQSPAITYAVIASYYELTIILPPNNMHLFKCILFKGHSSHPHQLEMTTRFSMNFITSRLSWPSGRGGQTTSPTFITWASHIVVAL